jgi:ferredoxin
MYGLTPSMTKNADLRKEKIFKTYFPISTMLYKVDNGHPVRYFKLNPATVHQLRDQTSAFTMTNLDVETLRDREAHPLTILNECREVNPKFVNFPSDDIGIYQKGGRWAIESKTCKIKTEGNKRMFFEISFRQNMVALCLRECLRNCPSKDAPTTMAQLFELASVPNNIIGETPFVVACMWSYDTHTCDVAVFSNLAALWMIYKSTNSRADNMKSFMNEHLQVFKKEGKFSYKTAKTDTPAHLKIVVFPILYSAELHAELKGSNGVLMHDMLDIATFDIDIIKDRTICDCFKRCRELHEVNTKLKKSQQIIKMYQDKYGVLENDEPARKKRRATV